MKKQVNYDELYEVFQDICGIEALLCHLEVSEYFKREEDDKLALRAIRNSIEHTKDKLKNILEESKEINN